ncbi:MAG TPA: hypothetical protein VGB64_04565 [Actinomycetota bacterium]
MRKQAIVGMLLAAVLAACGGGSKVGDNTADAGQSNAPTTAPPQAAGGGDCDYAKKFQENSEALGSQAGATGPDAVKKQMLDAAKAMDEAVSLAPAEIRPDVKKLADIYGQMINALAKYDFDYTKIPPEEIQTVFAFAQDTEYLEVAKRVGKYFADKCGLPDPFASTAG